jgi:hypothetical protein
VPALENTTQYSAQAREDGLNYLMNCSFVSGDTTQALTYASYLDHFYAQEGNSQKRQQLTQWIAYMKSAGKQ